ncbi:MAG: hypothetical protein U9R25_03300 [Chloroflexota bacterium]|nr:hypothetical protein [Chloroflexota bacterium]
MTEPDPSKSLEAASQYQKARRRALFGEMLGVVRGRSPELLSFDAVQSALGAWQFVEGREPEAIPLDKIVGSVGRYRDFTREFLPRDTVSEHRWRTVAALVDSMEGLPPIEVYQVGDIYFVRDGHHRVSVARANDFEDIHAYVTRVDTAVSIDAETTAEDLALKAAQADFLRASRVEQVRPDADLDVTDVGSYYELMQHIDVHRYYMGLEKNRNIPWGEAVASWYDLVYLPVAAAIWASDILDRFPDRTATDLYLWVCQHREELVEGGSVQPSPVEAVTSLGQQSGEKPKTGVVNTVKRALGAKAKTTDLAAEATKVKQRGTREDKPPAD